jgi:hypothetical protein
VIFKRGTDEQEGELFDMGPENTTIETTERFVKVSTFYSKDDRITHEPKMCDIILQTVNEEGGKAVFAKLEYNMAKFVRIQKTEIPDKISFSNSKFKNTFLEVKWTIFADDGLVKTSILSTESSEVYTQTEINEFISQASRLETTIEDLQSKIDMAENITKGFKIHIKSEKAHNQELEEKLAALDNNDEKIAELCKLLDLLTATRTKLEDTQVMRDGSIRLLKELQESSAQQLQEYEQALAEEMRLKESAKN